MAINSAAIRWHGNSLELLDQRLLPTQTVWLTISDSRQAANAIREMVVRGAPAIGITAAYGLALEAQRLGDNASLPALATAIECLASSRPTAVFPDATGPSIAMAAIPTQSSPPDVAQTHTSHRRRTA